MKRSGYFFVFASLLACALPATAGTFAFSQLCWASVPSTTQPLPQGTEDSYCSHAGPGSLDITQAIGNPDGTSPDQMFHGTTLATADVNAWHLAYSMDLTDYRKDMYEWFDAVPGNNNKHENTPASAGIEITDGLTVNGGTGVYDLNFVFSVDGSLLTTDQSTFQTEFLASLFMGQGIGTVTSFVRTGDQSFSSTLFTLSYSDLPFGGTINPTFFLEAVGFLPPLDNGDPTNAGANTITGSMSADFASTIHLTDVIVTDANGNPIPDVSITSTNGNPYPLDPANLGAVPEPACLGGIGLLALAAYRRLRKA